MVVNTVVSFRRLCFGREIVEIGLKRGRRNVQVASEHQGEDGKDTDDERCRPTERRRRLRKAFLKVRLIHVSALAMEHKNQQVCCGPEVAASR